MGKKNLLFHEELLSAGSVLGGPRPAGPLLQVSKLRFRELCLLSSLNQQVNLNQGFEPGHISKVRTAASQKQTQRPMETTWRSVENGEMTDFPKRSAKHAVPLAATLQCVCVCVCVRERERERERETVNLLWKALLSHTPQHNCKNDILGPGLIPSSTSYLLRLQGKDDFFPLSAKAKHSRAVI